MVSEVHSQMCYGIQGDNFQLVDCVLTHMSCLHETHLPEVN